MMVTKKDIANFLGISRTSVSLALNNAPNSTISEETKNKILNAARELGYRDSEISPKLCFIIYNRAENDPRYINDLKVVEESASRHNYRVIYMSIKASYLELQKLQKFLQGQEVEGVIVSGDIDDQLVELIEKSNVPYVFYGGIQRENVNSIVNDDKKIAYEATKYLISLGHRKIALFSGRLDLQIHRLNIEGYKQALKEARIPLDNSLIQISGEEDGYELCSRMQALGIAYSAVFCVNTIMQFGALQRLKESGVNVPHDVSLIGSGISEIVRVSVPHLTTMYVGPEEKELLVTRLLDIINEKAETPQSIYISNFELFEGGTVTCKNKI
ncbi:LacI family DNA-binding transcriptional regulator [Cohnella silvisoli]|uniref:LacI family DNA-binding transcriptional regulator n=1 Tax=Cohnella silvisoli TaxID=2873699 RepID=A0ABV1KY34_9BACL|nr:LacI family DNA-binding transcriptional regulator [Cohnella silvisoli]MCD9021865.1 LacI family transcriptional regulator [Cohnella silvisoli]